ncbi:aspartic proteinase 36-like isoform X2 [Zingiber officinale]|uniref:aspartic proteinase 36-like isoform X2 n=1 Tax=Zingiber officinale TaxID=94328 RepID=UPI001C4C998A|nr:aspartic proteinase 36-like isoform X2 [Zingiber officinale]
MWGPPLILLLAIWAVCLIDHVSSDKAGDWILPPKLRLERALPTKGIGLEHLRSRDRARHAGRSLLQSSAVEVVNFPLWGAANPFAVGLYYTRVQLGNPSKEFYVQIDTGSDILWVACNPCNGCPTSSGLNIQLEYFNPETSFASSQIRCSDDRCTSGLQNGETLCSTSSSSNSPCSYSFQYGDGSGTSGYYVSDTMYFEAVMGNQQTVNSSATIMFGCSNSQTGDLTKADRAVDGIFGFGQHQLSVISQLSSIGVTPRVFSHCLKGSDNGGGILVLGEIIEPGIVYTPLVPSQSHYNLHLESIAVNGKTLSISPSVFEVSNTHGTIIDSGTTLAYLAEQAYDPFVNAIIAWLSPSVRSVPFKGNECFITTGSIDESFPSVSLNFKGGASMPLKPEDYLLQQGYVDDSTIWCIGWQKNHGLGITILGDIILKDKIFVYDIANQRMGWTNYDCSQSVNVSVSSGKNQYLNTGQLDVNVSSRIGFDKLLWLSVVLVLHLLTSGGQSLQTKKKLEQKTNLNQKYNGEKGEKKLAKPIIHVSLFDIRRLETARQYF